ncbi:Zn-ribbon domain-containing OB-fold protein [Pseudomonas sp. BF-R-19]|uniref:Zn-ribbon domain-containing OB-fold protein n=1 Tax=Pseudomonas sp. BF-R-19 TaxID=2832397 RepID=UPI001CC16676|nr:OB-fold domain-containing protein [Pseudomonas sp. BF-R-19]
MDIRPDLEFQNFLNQGRFMIQVSRSSGRCVFYPRTVEPGTGADDLEWVQARGHGTVYATTIVRPKAPAAPYSVVLIDLDEGVRMMSCVEGIEPEAIQIGMPVRARISSRENQACIVFDPVRN